jgi:hypothetical protein
MSIGEERLWPHFFDHGMKLPKQRDAVKDFFPMIVLFSYTGTRTESKMRAKHTSRLA